jgi:hypothetical protein
MQTIGQVTELRRVPIAERERIRAFLLGRLRDFLSVLVCSGEKERLDSLLPVKPSEKVTDDRRVGVSNVRAAVDVVYRGSNEKVLLLCHNAHTLSR